MKQKVNYKGYNISTTINKVIVWRKSNPKKQMFTDKTIEGAKRAIDAWEANIECSNRIAATPQGKSLNLNVIRK